MLTNDRNTEQRTTARLAREIDDLTLEIFATTYGAGWADALALALAQLPDLIAYADDWDGDALESCGTVYLLHFTEPCGHSRHYIGWTSHLPTRLAQHRSGEGAALTRAAVAKGIRIELAARWEGNQRLEKLLKSKHNTPRLCPICQAEAKHKEEAMTRDMVLGLAGQEGYGWTVEAESAHRLVLTAEGVRMEIAFRKSGRVDWVDVIDLGCGARLGIPPTSFVVFPRATEALELAWELEDKA